MDEAIEKIKNAMEEALRENFGELIGGAAQNDHNSSLVAQLNAAKLDHREKCTELRSAERKIQNAERRLATKENEVARLKKQLLEAKEKMKVQRTDMQALKAKMNKVCIEIS